MSERCSRLSLKLAIDTNILTFYIHLQSLPDNNINRGCHKKITNICDKCNSSSMILNMNNSKTFTSHIKEYIYKASTEHQLLLIKVNRRLNFYNIFKMNTKTAEFLDRIKNPLHRSAIRIIVLTLKQGDTLSLRLLSI